MAILGLFDIGRSAIFASQTALDVTANNIANINTPGYSRKEAILEISDPVRTGAGFVGRGVTVGGIKRYYDRFLQAQISLQYQRTGRANILGELYRAVEGAFNEQQPGFSEAFSEYRKAWQEVSDNPEALPQRSVLLQSALRLAGLAKGVERTLTDLLEDGTEKIIDAVERINTTAAEISSLNEMIAKVEAGSSTQANDLRDRRDRLMNQLSELVDYSYFEDDRGRVTVIVGGRNLVSETGYSELTAVENSDGTVDIFGGRVRMNDYISGGRLSGLLAASEEIKGGPLKDFRRLIASIVKETNLQHREGYGLDGSTDKDFFSPLRLFTKDYSDGASITAAAITDYSSLNLHEYEIRFTDPGTYEVYDIDEERLVTSGSYTSPQTISFEGIEVEITDDAGGPLRGDRFFISPLEMAVTGLSLNVTEPEEVAAASAPDTLPSDNRNALSMAELLQGSVPDLGGSFDDHYRGIVGVTGYMSRAAQDSSDFEESLLEELRLRRESVSGVNLDEEAANLIRFQKAFEAGARLIRMTDELLEEILRL